MKITRISVSVADRDRELFAPALIACFTPFGSLTEGVDTALLASQIQLYLAKEGEEQVDLAGDILREVRSARTDQWSAVEFDRWSIKFRTPTSGTVITANKYAGGIGVDVDFGPNGSESRALTILAVAEKAKVRMEAFVRLTWQPGEKEIDRGNLIVLLEERAEAHLAWLNGLKEGYYNPEYRAEQTKKAEADVAFFEKLQ